MSNGSSKSLDEIYEKALKEKSERIKRQKILEEGMCPDCGSPLKEEECGHILEGVCYSCPPSDVTHKFLWKSWTGKKYKSFILAM